MLSSSLENKMKKYLSPLRNTTTASNSLELATEQLKYFGIDPNSDFGQQLLEITSSFYNLQNNIDTLWTTSVKVIANLDYEERAKKFNAQKFLSFQAAKLLNELQNPFRKSYQSLNWDNATHFAKGPYTIFDNVTAIFSATPVITRTATYIYSCAEWIADAFAGKELMLEIYSRLLNPTSVSLANYIVDIEAGPKLCSQYMAWNFNSGMAAFDATFSHILGRDDILIYSRHVYGGVYQLINLWYAKPSNLNIGVICLDGTEAVDFEKTLEYTKHKYRERLEAGRKIYLHLESPCNPHGYVLDVPAICKKAHENGVRVVLDSTVATPFLCRPLQRKDEQERPDFLIHSYTKDLSGLGSVIAGVVIGKNEDMFIPKGEEMSGVKWDNTLFWNVYYVKGAFLNSDAAFEVIQGMRTLDLRMLKKCINTAILAKFLAMHKDIKVSSHVIENHPNAPLRRKLMRYQLAAPLFTADFHTLDPTLLKRFVDNLSPTFSHMISIGQINTIISCPGLTTHSEMEGKAQQEANISTNTIRFAVGCENPKDLVTHLIATAKNIIDPDIPGFSNGFLTKIEIDNLIKVEYTIAHQRYIEEVIE